MTMYEIEQGLLDCIDLETGEVDAEKMDLLLMAKQEKLENVALWIKNLKALAKSIKEEEAILKQRREVAEKRINSLEQWLSINLDNQKFETAKCKVSFRKSERVEVFNVEKLPSEYVVEKVTIQPDKKLLKESLKNGITIDGVELIETQSIQIK